MPSRVFSQRLMRIERPRWQARALAVDADACSRKGEARAENEDAYLLTSLGCRPGRIGAPLLLAVADGLGGQASGELASFIATRSLVEALDAETADRLESDPDQALRQAVFRAHEVVLEEGRAEAGSEGMATTLTAGLVLWPRVHLVHVGDSRGYHLRRGTLRQITTDQTAAEILVRRGQLSPEAARRSRYRHILTSHLGGDDRMPEVESEVFLLEPGDGLLFATDGLTGALAEEELAEIASRPCSSHAVCHMLVDAARARGTLDDATAAFVRFGLPL